MLPSGLQGGGDEGMQDPGGEGERAEDVNLESDEVEEMETDVEEVLESHVEEELESDEAEEVESDEEEELESDEEEELESDEDDDMVSDKVEWETDSGPISFRSDVGSVHTKHDPYLMLYLVGDELGDDGSSSAGAGTGLHSVVYQTLPEDVVEIVLLWLPAAAQARCRAVCKTWLAILASPEFARRSFLQALSRTTPPPQCAVRFFPANFDWIPAEHRRLISPRLKSLKVDLSFLPRTFHETDLEVPPCSPYGLLCISRIVYDGMFVCVLNPVNQSFKVLPFLPDLWGFEILLSVETETVTATGSIPSFKVYVCGGKPDPNGELPTGGNDAAIYSSISGEWKCFLRTPGAGGLSAAACNGDVYTLVDSTPPRLLRVSTEGDAGYQLDVALANLENRPAEHLSKEVFLARHRGRILCCCSGIWMLDDDSRQWVAIAGRCPPDLLPPGIPRKRGVMLKNVHIAGDLVVFFYVFVYYAGDREVDWPVAYNMLGRFWRKVPHVIAQLGHVFQPMPNLMI